MRFVQRSDSATRAEQEQKSSKSDPSSHVWIRQQKLWSVFRSVR
jgi:hypothetical protein